MPIYEYICTVCKHHFDLMQKINEEPARQCPKCNEEKLVKLVSAAGFHLKGSGWYATDYKNTGKQGKSDSGETPTVTEAANSSANSATKPPKADTN